MDIEKLKLVPEKVVIELFDSSPSQWAVMKQERRLPIAPVRVGKRDKYRTADIVAILGGDLESAE
jgi:hypothetical protein